MLGLLSRYARWLHLGWPAGTVEKLPDVREDGSTNVPGIYVAGDLTGIPLLKFSADTGTRVVQTLVADSSFQKAREARGADVRELVIIGAGVSGVAAAVEAKKAGLDHVLVEAARPFATIQDFPKGKPIYTYPRDFTPAGDLQVSADVKEALVDELLEQQAQAGVEVTEARVVGVRRSGSVLEIERADGEPLRALRVLVAIGRSGNYRKLGAPGEDLDKVYNRLHDPADFCGKRALVVGGGDSALETAIALATCGSEVTLSYRKPELSRAKPENVEQVEALAASKASEAQGTLRLVMPSSVREIRADAVDLEHDGEVETIPNDVVFTMIGREPPLDFFRKSGIHVTGETRGAAWIPLILFFLAMCFVYEWKGDGFFTGKDTVFAHPESFPNNARSLVGGLGDWWQAQVDDRSTVIGTLAVSMKSRSFYYTLVYSLTIVVFGILRIRRRRTPYVKWQTLSLMFFQVVPLFLLPELVLPLLGYNGWYDAGWGKSFADSFFELYISEEAALAGQWPDWGHPRAYWRAYGFILAWPLMVYNVFTSAPIVGWLIVGFVQTFVLIPLLIWRYGKGVYCGWICSCGGLAETLGDTQRHKMPHGPFWNRLNFIGQAFLAIAFAMLFIRIGGWIWPQSWMNTWYEFLLNGKNAKGELVNPASYKWFIDVLFGGILGVGLYFKYSGRVWCRFACPLAALMHIYARFSRFRIFADKKKCISCNVCTSVCHQGIDVMNFANKGRPMEDPECVRCSACVQGCPTGVLSFGRIGSEGQPILDGLPASPVQMREKE